MHLFSTVKPVINGSDYDPNYAKILMVVNGIMDLDRYDDLLSRSIKKFENQVNTCGTNFVLGRCYMKVMAIAAQTRAQ